MGVNLKEKPFYLTDAQVDGVLAIYDGMSLDEKIGQLFCASIMDFQESQIKEVLDLHMGSLMLRPFHLDGIQENVRNMQEKSKYPMLVSANLEIGGAGIINEGTLYNMPMGATATGDMESGYRLGKISTAEAACVGINWGFAPIVDIDMNYRNPITNIRAFSGKKEEVLEMARGYLRAAKEEDVIPTLKHFPGDGTDERDQHLLVSVNMLDYDAWMESYGMIYQTLIDEGAPVIMAGHIAQPAVARKLHPDIGRRETFLPASQSKVLLTDLLRNRMGFNGLVVTDSTLMTGYMQNLPRKDALCVTIEAGADMILFNKNKAEDVDYLKSGYLAGKISEQRFQDAVLRVLALKMCAGLFEKQREHTLVAKCNPRDIVRQPLFKQWTRECADLAPTLVKDNGILPLSPEKTKRIYLNVIEQEVADESLFALDMRKRFEDEGFEVTLRKRSMRIDMNELVQGIINEDTERVLAEIMEKTEDFCSKYDLGVIVLNMPTESNATVVRVKWNVLAGLGNDIPWYAGEIPLVVVSFANPYHLLDIPMADVYVNAYTANEETRDAVMEKLMGRSEFKGVSPVDAFCGHEDTMV